MTDLICDANSLWARAFYASVRSEKLTELDGAFERPDDPVVVGVKMVLNILDPLGDRLGGQKVDRLLFCWDGKAKREKRRPIPKPEAYDIGLNEFVKALKALFGAAHARPPDNEADDAVATAVYRADPDTVIYVVSGDKDLQQLQSTNVRYYDLGSSQLLSRESILERWHVKRPSQICIALAVLGDPSDNISGIHGWGHKRVERLFEPITPDMDLARVLEIVEAQIPHDKLPEFRESLELTVLDPDVPGVPDPLPITFCSADLVNDLGLNHLIGRYLQVKSVYEGDVVTDEWVP